MVRNFSIWIPNRISHNAVWTELFGCNSKLYSANGQKWTDLSRAGPWTGLRMAYPKRRLAASLILRVHIVLAGEKGVGVSGCPLHYKGSIFHRIIPQFMCQVVSRTL